MAPCASAMADAVPFYVYGGGQILEAHGAACRKRGALSFGGSKNEQTRYVFADFGSFLSFRLKIKILEKRAELIVLC